MIDPDGRGFWRSRGDYSKSLFEMLPGVCDVVYMAKLSTWIMGKFDSRNSGFQANVLDPAKAINGYDESAPRPKGMIDFGSVGYNQYSLVPNNYSDGLMPLDKDKESSDTGISINFPTVPFEYMGLSLTESIQQTLNEINKVDTSNNYDKNFVEDFGNNFFAATDIAWQLGINEKSSYSEKMLYLNAVTPRKDEVHIRIVRDASFSLTNSHGNTNYNDINTYYNATLQILDDRTKRLFGILSDPLVMQSLEVQSWADITRPENTFHDTLPYGNYVGKFMNHNVGGKYSNPIQFQPKRVNGVLNDYSAYYIHPDRITYNQNFWRLPTRANNNWTSGLGPWTRGGVLAPYSAGCQVLVNDNFNQMNDILRNSIGFRNNDYVNIHITRYNKW